MTHHGSRSISCPVSRLTAYNCKDVISPQAENYTVKTYTPAGRQSLKLEQPFHMKPLVTREGGRGYQGYFDYFEPNGNHAYVVMTARYYTRYITPIVITLGRVMLSKNV